MIRLKFILAFIIITAIVLLSRVYFLSIKSNTYYEELSRQNYIKRVYETSSRGIIEDRNGVALAINNLGFSINIKPHLRSYKNKKDLTKVIDIIVKHFPKFTVEKLLKKYKKLDSPYRHDYVKLVDYIAYEDFFSKYTLFNSLDNIKIESAVKRHYPYGSIGSHIIGYVGKASRVDIKNNRISKYSGIIGKNGLEKFYNNKLQGELGFKDIKVNALNKEVEILEEKLPSSNNKLKTTIDIRLQKYINKVFDKKSGAVIVMDANNGEILAGASFPEYDNNIFVGGISTDEWEVLRNDFNHPFTNKLVNGLYPPGSVIKMGVALAFLENGVKENFSVFDSGELTLGKRKFRCWKAKGHGHTNFNKAIRESCDDFFYKGSLIVGINKISKTLSKFGFGEKTGVDQVNEFKGVNPNKIWKKAKYNMPWYVGETVISSIGQGFVLVTPLQIARYTAFLASGKLPTPHFTKENYKEPVPIKVNKKHLNKMRKAMYEVANHPKGTLRNYIRGSKVKIAGKTGTAQVVGIPQSEKKRMKEHELEYFHRSHAWVTTYAPYKNPKYVVTIIVEHGGHGGSAAGKMLKQIYAKLQELKYID